MGFSRVPIRMTIMDQKASDGIGIPVLINDYKNVHIALATDNNADLTIKIQGSLQSPDNKPNFSAPPSPTNQWDYIGSWDYSNAVIAGSGVAGSTGYVFSGADSVKNILGNFDGLVWLNLVISNYVAGDVYATLVAYNNQ